MEVPVSAAVVKGLLKTPLICMRSLETYICNMFNMLFKQPLSISLTVSY